MRSLLSVLTSALLLACPVVYIVAGEYAPSPSANGIALAPSSVTVGSTSADCIKAGTDGLTLNADCDTKRVGIGITLPTAKLEVLSNSASTGFVVKVSSQDATGIAVIRGDGKVGIGNTSPTAGLDILNKTVQADYLDDTASADGTVYNLFRATAGSSSPALNAEVGVLSGQYNWRKGDNQTFTAEGVEGVVRVQGADESMTARGVYGRFYIDPAYSATLRTGIGGEFSARASYLGGTEIAAESGTAFVGSRIWMAPYFSDATIANVNNFHGLWIYNEATAKTVTNGIKLGGAGGTAFTNDLNLQNGEVITNATDGAISIFPYTTKTATFTVADGNLALGGGLVTAGAISAATGAVGTNKLSVAGSVAIGSAYVGATGPTDGMIIAGNVGIGTTNPTSKLHVDGTGFFNSSVTLSGGFGSPSYANATLFVGNKGGAGLYLGQDSAVSPYSYWMQTSVANSDATQYPLLLNPLGGNVGIGTTNPNAKLTVQDGALAQTNGAVTVADTGEDADAATVIVDVSSGTFHLTCSDDDGTTVTMGEANAKANQYLLLVALGAQTCTLDDQADILALNAAAGAYGMTANDTLLLYYTGAIWLEVARSVN
jgi:hypothetical protein